VIILFIIVLLLRIKTDVNSYVILGLEGVGIILLSFAGWLGGTLVVRNQIGVDHRYANAGKWNEEKIKSLSNSIELKDLEKLNINQMRLLHINGKRIVIARTESEYVAFDDFCTHRGGSLADGVMICGTVQCPWHGSQFDVKLGTVKAGPANDRISTYRIEVNNQKYFLQLNQKL
jgi:nitrite reductase/ring-hydroxylating ferredoxin subunit